MTEQAIPRDESSDALKFQWFYIGQVALVEYSHLIPEDQFIIKIGISTQPYRRFQNYGPRYIDCTIVEIADSNLLNQLEQSVKAHSKQYRIPDELLDHIPKLIRHPTELRLMDQETYDDMLNFIDQFLGGGFFDTMARPAPGR